MNLLFRLTISGKIFSLKFFLNWMYSEMDVVTERDIPLIRSCITFFFNGNLKQGKNEKFVMNVQQCCSEQILLVLFGFSISSKWNIRPFIRIRIFYFFKLLATSKNKSLLFEKYILMELIR